MNTLRRVWAALTAPLVADDPAPEWSTLDRLDAIAGPRCPCGAPGTVPVRAGFDNYTVCPDHAPVRV